MLHPKFQSLKWITPEYKNNPAMEIKIKRSFKILNSRKEKSFIITHYQFFSACLIKEFFILLVKPTYDSISLPKKTISIF